MIKPLRNLVTLELKFFWHNLQLIEEASQVLARLTLLRMMITWWHRNPTNMKFKLNLDVISLTLGNPTAVQYAGLWKNFANPTMKLALVDVIIWDEHIKLSDILKPISTVKPSTLLHFLIESPLVSLTSASEALAAAPMCPQSLMIGETLGQAAEGLPVTRGMFVLVGGWTSPEKEKGRFHQLFDQAVKNNFGEIWVRRGDDMMEKDAAQLEKDARSWFCQLHWC